MLGLVEAFACIALMGCGGGGGGGNDGSSISIAEPDGGTGSPAPTTAAAPATLTSGVIQPSLVPSRTSGVAPLAVHFDATGTTSATPGIDTFRQVRYAFNFGDDRGQSWAVSGKPKNSEVGGPIAAHVFDLPGTYTVRLRATDPSGNAADTSVIITVQDPNTVYLGTKTICVSTANIFTGCPSGAMQQSSLPTSYSGKRILLRRGESFPEVRVQYSDDNTVVGAYGSGEKPRVPAVRIGGGTPIDGVFPDDITVMDLQVSTAIIQQDTISRLLLLRNTVDYSSGSTDVMLSIGSAFDYDFRAHPEVTYYNPREIFIVENTVTGNTSASGPSYNFFGLGSRIAMLGNDMGKSQQHTARFIRLDRAIIAHNALRGQSLDGTKHSLKIHSGGLGDYNDNTKIAGLTWASRNVVASSNIFGDASDNNVWTVAIGPQNETYTEGIEKFLFENNNFVRGTNTSINMFRLGRNVTIRNNTLNTGAALSIGDAGKIFPAIPTDWKGPYFSQ